MRLVLVAALILVAVPAIAQRNDLVEATVAACREYALQKSATY
jgi:hypothetical protein